MLTESTTSPAAADGCAWWNLACQGGEALADSGLSVVTKAIATGVTSLLGQITRVIDESTQVPLADAGYRETYRGFLGLAVPLIIVILLAALLMASLQRDPSTFTRAVSGLVVATVGGGLYIGFAQLLIAIDNWLSHSIVRVTGHGLPDGIASLATGFEAVAGYQGDVAANMLLIILMLIVLLAGLMLWFVLVLRKIAILVVVAFAPLLIAGWLWSPTRSWARRATEVLVALVFTKSAIFALFGIGLSILFTSGGQSLSDFVGAVILLCGACFAPLMMLRLVHFAADSQIAGDMMGTLRGGVQPVLSHLPSARSATRPMGRHDLASQYDHGSSMPSPVTAGRIDVGASPNANQQQSGTTPTSPGVPKATTSVARGAASSGLAGIGAGATYAFTSRTSQSSEGTPGPTRTAGNQQPRHDEKNDVDGPVALGPTPDADNPQEQM